MLRTLAILLTSALLLSGCAGNDKGTDSGTDGTGGNDGSGGSGSTGGSGTTGTTTGPGGTPGNSTKPGQEYSCDATPGGVVGVGGGNGATVSGCQLATASGSVVYTSEEIDSGCDVSVFLPGETTSSGSPEVGATYDDGTGFSLGCGPTNPTGSGKIVLTAA